MGSFLAHTIHMGNGGPSQPHISSQTRTTPKRRRAARETPASRMENNQTKKFIKVCRAMYVCVPCSGGCYSRCHLDVMGDSPTGPTTGKSA